MNNERRKAIVAAQSQLEALRDRAADHLEGDKADADAFWATVDTSAANIVSALEGIRDEEQEAYDNMPESFQNGDKGEQSQAAIEALESAIDMIGTPSEDKDGAADDLQTAIDYLEEAQA